MREQLRDFGAANAIPHPLGATQLRRKGYAGHAVSRSALGWSFTNQADAERHAQQRVEWAVSKAIGNQFEQYSYGHVPPREPVRESISLNGETALITRNRYGCRALNTDRVLFADVDLPQVERIKPRRPREANTRFAPNSTSLCVALP